MAGEKPTLTAYGRAPQQKSTAHRRQGSRLPVCPLPRRRHGARAGNALHRRGHGLDTSFGYAFPKASLAPAPTVPMLGNVLCLGARHDNPASSTPSGCLVDLGFNILATGGTQRFLADQGVPASASTRCSKAARTSSMDEERQCAAGVQHHRGPRRWRTPARCARPRLCKRCPITPRMGCRRPSAKVAKDKNCPGERDREKMQELQAIGKTAVLQSQAQRRKRILQKPQESPAQQAGRNDQQCSWHNLIERLHQAPQVCVACQRQ
jgi:hypothetical protein